MHGKHLAPENQLQLDSCVLTIHLGERDFDLDTPESPKKIQKEIEAVEVERVRGERRVGCRD